MSRLHLFELADQPWFPRTLADAGTSYLNTLQERFGLVELLVPYVERALPEGGSIVDLCSGGGGPAVAIAEKLDVDVVLTDLTPNEHVMVGAGHARLHPVPVDARAVPADLVGLRTVFNALHHFRPEQAREVLADAQRARQPILVVELSERGVLPLTVGTAFIPLMVALMMPFVRPVRPLWLLLTYLVPVLPLTIAWDGWVSHWRTYAPDELEALVDPLQEDGWTWTWGRDRAGPGSLTWLWGGPS